MTDIVAEERPRYHEYIATTLGYVALFGTPLVVLYAAGMHDPQLFFGAILGGALLGGAVSIYLRGNYPP